MKEGRRGEARNDTVGLTESSKVASGYSRNGLLKFGSLRIDEKKGKVIHEEEKEEEEEEEDKEEEKEERITKV